MSQFYGNSVPGIGPVGTSTPRNILFSNQGAVYYAPGVVVNGALSRDTGNTNDTQTLRCGMVMGKVTSSGQYAPFALGNVSSAYNGGTSLTVGAAVATEVVRRLGSSGTLKLIGPPTAAGTVRTSTLTYSGVDTGTGIITVTAIAATSTWTLTEAAGTDGGTFRIRVTTPDGVVATTTDIAYNETAANIDTAVEALSNVGTGGVAVTGSSGGPYTLVFVSTLGDVQVSIVNDSTNDGGVWEGGVVAAQTVVGVDGRFIVGSFVSGTDGTETPLGIMGDQWGLTVTDIYQNNLTVQLDLLLVGGMVIGPNLIYWPSDTSLQAWLISALKAVGIGFVNQKQFIA